MKKTVALLVMTAILFAVSSICVNAGMDSSMFVAVDGIFEYNEEDKTIHAGHLSSHDHLAVSEIFVAPHQSAEFSVDFKYVEFNRNGGGIGLFFDSMDSEARGGVADGMGILTWTGQDFSQVKTWNWNFIDVATDLDYWDQVAEDVAVYGDTETVYNLHVEVFSNSTLEVTLTNKTTGASHVLKEGPLDLVNEEGFYVGLLTLNLTSVYLDFTYELGEVAAPISETSETAEDSESIPATGNQDGESTDSQTNAKQTEGTKEPDVTTAGTALEDGNKTGLIIGIVAAVVVVAAVAAILITKKKK